MDYRYKKDEFSMEVYRFFYSKLWRVVRSFACVLFLYLSSFDKPFNRQARISYQVVGDLVCLVVFALDVSMQGVFNRKKDIRKAHWLQGMIVLLLATVTDMLMRGSCKHQWSGILRPYVLFYYSDAARLAAVTTWRVLPSMSVVCGL